MFPASGVSQMSLTMLLASSLIESGLLVANRVRSWKGGKGGQPSLITAIPAKQGDGPNAPAVYHAHRMSLMSFKDHCYARFPIPSATDLLSIQFLPLEMLHQPMPMLLRFQHATPLGNNTYSSPAGYLENPSKTTTSFLSSRMPRFPPWGTRSRRDARSPSFPTTVVSCPSLS